MIQKQAVITNSKGEIQKTTIGRDGRPLFKRHWIHQWQMHTHIGYKEGLVIHHLDHDKMNNSLENLVYITQSEHAKLHMKGENNPMFGKTGGMYGKHHSLETKKKMSEAQKAEKHYMFGKHLSSEAKKKLSEINKGELNPFYGKTHSNESKRKISDSGKRRFENDEERKKISDSLKGKYKWITNGIESICIAANLPIPDGFRKGRTINRNRKNVGVR